MKMRVSSKEKTLLPPDSQAVQRGIITEKTLSFLVVEIFTSTEILQEYLGYASRLGCMKAMNRLKKVGYITDYDLDTLAGRKIKLWGITSKGVYAISDPEIMSSRIRVFTPAKISLLTLPHRLKSHEIAIRALSRGYILKNAIEVFKPFPKVPDLVVFDPKEEVYISLEIELTIKTVSRYKKIIEAYSEPIKLNVVDTVIWILPTVQLCIRLQKIFEANSEHSIAAHQFMTMDQYKLSLISDNGQLC